MFQRFGPFRLTWVAVLLLLPIVAQASADAQTPARLRARALGIPFPGIPGPLNAITDVPGVTVGHGTVIRGEGVHAARTGVTAVLPRGVRDGLFAGTFVLNGNGEWIGSTFINETGYLFSPILLTNTVSIGTVRDAVIRWSRRAYGPTRAVNLPVIGETWDGFLNDIYGFHVTEEHVVAALNGAASGPVAEGNVGGGTGMRCYQFKCGIGTASRLLTAEHGGYTVGVLVQANFGIRRDLIVAGIPVGQEIPDLLPQTQAATQGDGSILIVVATNAPLLPHQLQRVAKRAALGLARAGGIGDTDSGDLILAFSTEPTPYAFGRGGNPMVEPKTISADFLKERYLDPILESTVEATEEAIINALVAGETMTGVHGNRVFAIPHQRVRDILRRHGRLLQ